MKVGKCFVDAMVVGERLRAIDPEKVAMLAESIAAIGLQQPISVWSPRDGDLNLIAGRHRFEAVKKLGQENPDDYRWEEIDCVFLDMDDLDRQLWEIDENLCRADLSPTELANHLKRRKELWEKRQSVQVAPVESKRSDGKGHRPKGFAADTAKNTGVDKTTVNRAVSRAEAIPADVFGKIQGTELDKGTYLDKLKKLTHEEQRERVERDVLSERKRKSRRTSAEIRLDNFDHAVRAIVNTLSLLQLIDVPPLDDGQLSQVETDLRNARKALSKFIKTVQRANDENQAS